MTAASGEPGDKPTEQGPQQPQPGGFEAPPIEQVPPFPPPYPAPPAYGGYAGQGYPPPPSAYPPAPPYAPPPEYGAPYPGGYGTFMPPAAGTNPLAIFSLVASCVGLLCGFGSIIGIVLGVIAMNQIKRTGQQGRGLAVAGVAVGAVSLVISVIWMAFALRSS